MQCFNVEFSLAALWRLSALNTQELHPHGLWRSSRFGEVFAQGPLSLCMCVTTESTTNAENLTTTSEAPGSCLCAHVSVYIVPFVGTSSPMYSHCYMFTCTRHVFECMQIENGLAPDSPVFVLFTFSHTPAMKIN